MKELQLVINRKIEIMIDKEVYRSNIQDLNHEFISISIPTINGEYIPLHRGQDVDVLYYDKDYVFEFNSKVIGRKIDGIPVIMLTLPESYSMIQRRRYFRVSCVEYTKYLKLERKRVGVTSNTSDIRKLIGTNEKFKKALLIDLSGGGLKLKVSEKVEVGDIVLIDLEVLNSNLLLKGEIVRADIDEDKKYICGVKFNDLTEKERENIIQHTFSLMRKQRRIGMKED